MYRLADGLTTMGVMNALITEPSMKRAFMHDREDEITPQKVSVALENNPKFKENMAHLRLETVAMCFRVDQSRITKHAV